MGRILTDETSVVVPSGILAAGERHFLILTARRQGDLGYVPGSWRHDLPMGQADVASAVFVP